MDEKKPWSISSWAVMAAVTFIFLFHNAGGDAIAVEGNSAKQKPACVTNSCHGKMGTDKFVHGPVATGDCTFCHVLDGKHKFKRIDDV